MKWILVVTALLGGLSVALAAAGDHMLSAFLAAGEAHRFEIALRYHQFYSFVLLALSLYGVGGERGRLFTVTCSVMLGGLILFSGGLYLAVFSGLEWPVFSVPVGGLTLMAGWALLVAYALQIKTKA